MLEESVRRIDAFRDAHPEHPIVDVQYADLSPIRRRRCARSTRAVGDELDDTGAQAIAALRRRAPARPVRRTQYDVSEYGLDAGELAERFSGYTDRYAVPREH